MLRFSLFRAILLLFCCGGNVLAAHATHMLGGDLTYEYAGTAASPNLYRVTARIYSDGSGSVNVGTPPTAISLACSPNGCTVPTVTATLTRAAGQTVATSCTGTSESVVITTLQGLVTLPPAQWQLTAGVASRVVGITNIAQSGTVGLSLNAELDNSTGLVNSSPRFTASRPVHLVSAQAQRYSLSAFDSEGDSLVYEAVQPLTGMSLPTTTCPVTTTGTAAPHLQLNAATGELLNVAGAAGQLGIYALAARVNEYRRVNGAWQKIGSVMRELDYYASAGTNQAPAFTRVALAAAPTGQLLGQEIRIAAGQTATLILTAADTDAGQSVTLSSEVAGLVPGAAFQPLANGQGQLTWQVPAALPQGRYRLTVTALDDACPLLGHSVLTLSFLVTRTGLATAGRQALAQAPFPAPFSEAVRFQFAGRGVQPVVITDALGRQVAKLATTADGSAVWQPGAALPAGLYFARNTQGTQVARLQYSGK
ncbi:Ig-like domain-containing protein [Hymenobacter properus]|uniref:T9SS type A sorting domain-containing protein n=1 Tax=Hymenobacter properus TaxID=2791026 RepID=A0A931BGN5_9BACT|nr:hypothetical protein [Hymenobacter properus]MBF9141962.1 hypothetical protein [Hymenobacter properus]MBR7720769.1 hypothetical protein [Microvirga sp. SRT04]